MESGVWVVDFANDSMENFWFHLFAVYHFVQVYICFTMSSVA